MERLLHEWRRAFVVQLPPFCYPSDARQRSPGPNPPWGAIRVVGKANRKVDGLAKATGEALYPDDIALPGMVDAKTLRSPHPHARIKRIGTSKARALPGVHAVIIGRDLPTPYGVIPWTPDENALAVDKVRFAGDEVAAVTGRGWIGAGMGGGDARCGRST